MAAAGRGGRLCRVSAGAAGLLSPPAGLAGRRDPGLRGRNGPLPAGQGRHLPHGAPRGGRVGGRGLGNRHLARRRPPAGRGRAGCRRCTAGRLCARLVDRRGAGPAVAAPAHPGDLRLRPGRRGRPGRAAAGRVALAGRGRRPAPCRARRADLRDGAPRRHHHGRRAALLCPGRPAQPDPLRHCRARGGYLTAGTA